MIKKIKNHSYQFYQFYQFQIYPLQYLLFADNKTDKKWHLITIFRHVKNRTEISHRRLAEIGGFRHVFFSATASILSAILSPASQSSSLPYP